MASSNNGERISYRTSLDCDLLCHPDSLSHPWYRGMEHDRWILFYWRGILSRYEMALITRM